MGNGFEKQRKSSNPANEVGGNAQGRPLDNVVKLPKPDFCDIFSLYNTIQNTYKDVLIIDIRNENDFAASRIFDSINVEFEKFLSLMTSQKEVEFVNGLQSIFFKVFKELGGRQIIETVVIIPDINMAITWENENDETNKQQMIDKRLIFIRNIQKYLQSAFQQYCKFLIVDQPFDDFKEKFTFLCYIDPNASTEITATTENESDEKKDDIKDEKNERKPKESIVLSANMEDIINIPKSNVGSIQGINDDKTKIKNKNESENKKNEKESKENKNNEQENDILSIRIDKYKKDENSVQRYRYPAQILNDKLFLGNWTHGNNSTIITNLGITHVLNVTPNISELDPTIIKKMLQIEIFDNEKEDILSQFDKMCQFIHKALSSNINNKVLVHCQMGVSRSAASVCAYLIKHRHMTTDEAIAFCVERRPIVEPNEGFIKQLKKFEKICQDSSD